MCQRGVIDQERTAVISIVADDQIIAKDTTRMSEEQKQIHRVRLAEAVHNLLAKAKARDERAMKEASDADAAAARPQAPPAPHVELVPRKLSITKDTFMEQM